MSEKVAVKETRKGTVIVNTGDGKGKTTAALGMVFRALGHGMRVCVIQFIKSENGQWGEVKTGQRMGIEWLRTGDGFTWLSKDLDESAALARHGWEIARQKITSGEYDLILLDEFTYPLQYGWLDCVSVVEWLRQNKPEQMHLIITGRGAPQALLDYADLVTEMKLVKHPYQQGKKAQAGVEY